ICGRLQDRPQLRLQNPFDVDRDPHLVADDAAVVLQRAVPAHPEVLPVDPRPASEPNARHADGVIRGPPAAEIVEIEYDISRSTADVQRTLDFVIVPAHALDGGTAEGEARMSRDVQEIGAAQVIVALRFSGPQPLGLDRRFQGREYPRLRIELQAAVDIFEMSPYPRHHHVTDAEFGSRVSRLKD